MLTGKTLDQILGVLEFTEKYYATGLPIVKAYQKSVKNIAHQYSVRYQTIADGCRRRLNLVNINEFMELLNEWFGGNPSPLKDLLIKNIGELDKYKVENFFDHNRVFPSTSIKIERKVEEAFEVITFKTPQNIASQLRSLAEAEGKSIQEFMNIITKNYVDRHYVEYLKNLISSLPQEHKEQVIAELTNSLESK
jgi:hypothetical protein